MHLGLKISNLFVVGLKSLNHEGVKDNKGPQKAP